MADNNPFFRTSSRASQAIKFLLQSTSTISASPQREFEKEKSESSELPPNVSSRAVNFLNIENGDRYTHGIWGLCNLLTVWDNEYSIKILGSRNAVEKEEYKRKQMPHFLIHPCSRARLYWDTMLLIVLLFNTFLLPVSIAFYNKIPIAWLIFNFVSDLILLTDILSNFWSGVVTDDNFVFLNLNEIRWNYVKSFLIVDIASVLPFDYIEYILYSIPLDSSSNVTSNMLRILQPFTKLLSLIKIVRALKLVLLLKKWKERFMTSWSIPAIAYFVFGVVVLCHWNGCIQFLVVSIEGFPPNSWIAINNLQNATVGTQYSYAILKAFSHMLCIGYGQVPPRTTTDIWITMISMLIGAILYGMFVGHMTSFIYSATISTRRYSEKIHLVEEYMKYHRIPQKLKIKVKDYFYHKYHGRLFDEKSMLNELSHILREEINKFHYQDVVKLVSIFKDVDQTFINAITSKFRFEVFLEGDYIINYNTVGHTMYFIQHGEAQVINSKGEELKTLVDGDYFGEISLLLNERRQGSIKASTVCFVFCLERDDFNTVLNRFPNLRASLEVKARERLQELYRSEDRSPDHFHSIFSERLTESETLASASESQDDIELESTESFLCSYAGNQSSKQLPLLEVTPSALSVPKTPSVHSYPSKYT